jgi:hypothetical protein
LTYLKIGAIIKPNDALPQSSKGVVTGKRVIDAKN